MKRDKPREIEVDGVDLLLLAAIGILLVVVLCMVVPMVSWPQLHPLHWYWIRIVYYSSHHHWVYWSVVAFLATGLALLLWIRPG